jgi:CysZ protein
MRESRVHQLFVVFGAAMLLVRSNVRAPFGRPANAGLPQAAAFDILRTMSHFSISIIPSKHQSLMPMKRFFTEFWLGLRSYYDGALFIARYRLWLYFIVPVGLSVGLYYLGEYYDSLSREVDVQAEDMRELMFVLIEKLVFKMLYYLFHESTKYIVVMILSPVLAILSEKVEEILTGNTYPFVWRYYINDIKRGLRISITSLVQEYALFFAWLMIAFFIPALQVFTPVMALLIGFYFYGFGFIDYINERRRLDIAQSNFFIRKHAGLAIGIGVVYSFMFMIPYGGVVIAPILAMVGTTLAMNLLVDLKDNRYAVRKLNDQDQGNDVESAVEA